MTHIRLEYSEQQQCFHYNYGDQPEETNGYRTLVESIDIDLADDLVEIFNKLYPYREVMSFEEIKDYFNGYE